MFSKAGGPVLSRAQEGIVTVERLAVWVLVGGIAGWGADWLVSAVHLSLVGAVVVGMLGAVVGGWLFGAIGLRIARGFFGNVVVALAGAVLLLLAARAVRWGS